MEARPIASIILAAGKGTRMRSDTKHKVCFEVGGVPVILRALRAYEECGITHHVIVVGDRAEQVMSATSQRFPNVAFAYQRDPLGTGHAAKCGAYVLERSGFEGDTLVVAGDKVIKPRAIGKLMNVFYEQNCDLAFLVGDVADSPTCGRVLCDDEGQPVGIVEVSEIRLAQALAALDEMMASTKGQELPSGPLLAAIRRCFPDDDKARLACGELHSGLAPTDTIQRTELRRLMAPLRQLVSIPSWREGRPITVSAADVEAMDPAGNRSVYLCRAAALYQGLRQLSRDNAQREEFLTDIIRNLAAHRSADGHPKFRLRTVPLDAEADVLAFNTPEELREIEKHLAHEPRMEIAALPRGLAPANFKLLAEWRGLFESPTASVQAFFERTYGHSQELHEAKRKQYLRALSCYQQHVGKSDKVMLVRSPGRINLLGRHIDHRGGHTNMVAISEETIVVASPRSDDRINLYNTDSDEFDHAAFSVADEIANLDWADWLTCVNSPKTLALVRNGHWGNYVRAAALRLQERFRDHRLHGADLAFSGTIPIGSGLSSSSAVVVAAAEALVAINDLPVRPSSFVDLCGEGEWFVGTRGGSADHAAIKLSKPGQVAHMSFFPFEVREFVPFLADHSLVVCNSGEAAKKSERARETFNLRILGYLSGELIFKRLFPEFAPSVQHLRDINCENLGVSLAELYRMLARIPVQLSRARLMEEYGPFPPEDIARLRSLLATLGEYDDPYPVRGVVLFGLAECERSRICVDLLRRGDADGLGRLWSISHDGDRVVTHDKALKPRPFRAPEDDAYLLGLAAQCDSGDPAAQAAAQLHLQPGSYRCSTPTIDRIVDIACRVPGVKGAQIAGAGLGGCAMILVQAEARDRVCDALGQHGFQAEEYAPVAGAGLVEI